MCKLCESGHKAINTIYINHTAEDCTKVIIPICTEKIEQFKREIYKVRKKFCGPIKAGVKNSSVCVTCGRDTKAPLFDGCMTHNCPKGYKPCL